MARTSRKAAANAKTLIATILAGATLAALSGCQDGTNTEAEPGESQDAVVKQQIRPEVQERLTDDLKGKYEDALPKEYQDKDTLVMATDATMGEPIAVMSEEDEAIEGYTVDLAQSFGHLFGKDINVVNATFDTFIPGLQAKRYDFSMSIMLDTEERQKSVDFVDYMMDGSSILVSADSKLSDLTLNDMCGLKAGALRGSVESTYLEDQTKECTDNGDEPIDIGIYQGNNDMYLAVTSGRLDVMMGASAQLAYVEKVSNGEVREGGDPVGQALDGIALPKDQGLAEPFKAALQELIDTGIYLEILKDYGMEANAVKEATINNAV